MSTDISAKDTPGRCARCENAIEPFGVGAHIFYVEDVGFVCTSCARNIAPEQVQVAEQFEEAARERGWEPNSG